MKYRILLQLFIISCALLALCSCSKDDDAPSPMEEETLKTFDIGEYRLLDESISKLPYLNKTKVTFVDSLNNRIDLTINEADLFQTDSSYLFRYDVFEEGDTVRYLYFGENKTFQLYNDSLNIHFSHELRARPYYMDPEKQYIADVLSIWLRNPENQNRLHGVFYHVVNQRTWPTASETVYSPSKVLLDKVFNDVYYSDYANSISEVYYNYEFGIVSFTDRDGKTWRFHEME